MEPTHLQRIKAPMDGNREPRVLWLAIAAPPSEKRAKVVDVVAQAELPAQYAHLPRLPSIETHVSGYNAWLAFREQFLTDDA